MSKRMLLLLCTVFCSPLVGAEAPQPMEGIPSYKPMASLEGLPNELKNIVIQHAGLSGGVLNIPALAQGLITLAATSKSLHATINNSNTMIAFLKLLPRSGAKLLAEKLQTKAKTLPVMKSDEVQKWLNNLTLQDGEDLFKAINTRRPDLSRIFSLLENPNININWQGHNGNTSLMSASRSGWTEVVKRLIALGADVNAKDNFKFTPLMNASYHAEPEVIKLLIIAGADLMLTNKYGETALDIARRNLQRYPSLKFEYIETIKPLEAAEKAQKEKTARK